MGEKVPDIGNFCLSSSSFSAAVAECCFCFYPSSPISFPSTYLKRQPLPPTISALIKSITPESRGEFFIGTGKNEARYYSTQLKGEA